TKGYKDRSGEAARSCGVIDCLQQSRVQREIGLRGTPALVDERNRNEGAALREGFHHVGIAAQFPDVPRRGRAAVRLRVPVKIARASAGWTRAVAILEG